MISWYELRSRRSRPEASALSRLAETDQFQRSQTKARSRLSKTSPHLPPLPAEIIHCIIAFSFPETSLLDPRTLRGLKLLSKRMAASLDPYHHLITIFKSLVLVCKSWAHITENIFYRTLVLRGAEQVSRLADTLQFWAPDFPQSPLRHVRGIHLCAKLYGSDMGMVREIVQCVREANQTHNELDTVTLSQVGFYRAGSIPWAHVPMVLVSSGNYVPHPLLSIPMFCYALQTLHVVDTVFEASDDAGNTLCPVFPYLTELHLSVGPHYGDSGFHQPFSPGNWSLPSLQSITISGWHRTKCLDVINFLPFLQKYGSQVDHFFLDGSSANVHMLSSYLSPERIQDCLDALPELRHLVLTQMPWKAFRGQLDEVTQFSHTKLTWIDYGVVPSVENFLGEDIAAFSPTPLPFSFTDLPRIRGGVRTLQRPRWSQELIAELTTPGPIPPGWGLGLPNLQALRKVDFSLFPLMPSLTRDILPPVLGGSETRVPFSKDAVIRETKGRVYLWPSKIVLRKKWSQQWDNPTC